MNIAGLNNQFKVDEESISVSTGECTYLPDGNCFLMTTVVCSSQNPCKATIRIEESDEGRSTGITEISNGETVTLVLE